MAAEGWTWDGQTWHYVRDGRTLCGVQAPTHVEPLGLGPDSRNPLDCSDCRAVLDAHEVARD